MSQMLKDFICTLFVVVVCVVVIVIVGASIQSLMPVISAKVAIAQQATDNGAVQGFLQVLK